MKLNPIDQHIGTVYQYLDTSGIWKDCKQEDISYYQLTDHGTRKLDIFASHLEAK